MEVPNYQNMEVPNYHKIKVGSGLEIIVHTC